MVKQEAHIDIVFRDGLKNLEVLPPPDVWDAIQPAISPARSRGVAFRIAAGIAAMVSLGLLAWFVGTRSIDSISGRVDASAEGAGNADFLLSQRTSTANRIASADKGMAGEEGRVIRMHAIDEVPGDVINGQSGFKSVFTRNRSSNPSLTLSDNASVMMISEMEGDEVPYSEEEQYQADDINLLPENPGSDDVIKNNRWMVGAKVSPTYLSTNLKSANSEIASAGSDESALLSYTGGVTVSYAVGSRLSVQTGILYSSLGRQISDISSYTGYSQYAGTKGGKIFGVQTSAGEIASTNNDIFLIDQANTRISSIYSARNFDPEKANLELFGNSLRQNFEYLEVPLMLSYKLVDRRVDFNILGGMSYNFLLRNSVYAVSDESTVAIGSTEEMNTLFLSSALGMSMHYALNDRFSLNLEPSFRYYLNSDGRLSANNPFTFGLFSGIYYKF